MKNDEMVKRLKKIRRLFIPGGNSYLALTEAIAIVSHNTKLIIFDMDDVMWDLNRRVSKRTKIPYEKFTMFSFYKNPNFTEEEKHQILKAYEDPNTFRNIPFKREIIALINRIHNEHPDCTVQIVSNCSSKQIRDLKMEQLLGIVDIPEKSIHLHLIDIETQSEQKKFPENVYLLVDDSPHNIAISDALYRVMPKKPFNYEMEGVDRPELDEELAELVMGYITAK